MTAIPFKKYVSITSRVGGASTVARREFILRLISTDELTPVGSVLEFTSAANVASYYGTTSPEYRAAVVYFGFISKQGSRANRISYSRHTPAAVPPVVIGGRITATIQEIAAITAGSMSITLGTDTFNSNTYNFTGDEDFNDVAQTLQTEIRRGTGAQFTTATVEYDAAFHRFIITGSVAVNADVDVEDLPTMNNFAASLGLIGSSEFSRGSVAQTPLEAIQASIGISNNFGSFSFLEGITDQEAADVAQFNASENNAFMFLISRPVNGVDSLVELVSNFSGTSVEASDVVNAYNELLPACVFAATDYTGANASQNYMFQQGAFTVAVSDPATSDRLDALRVNYYGQTQTAGQQLAFYQRGVLQGTAADALDMQTYTNEAWLKDEISVRLMSLLLASTRISANLTGVSKVVTIIEGAVDLAKVNGTISIGKTLDDIQKSFITDATLNPDAWRDVESKGYVLNARVVSEVVAGATEFRIVYTLIYSKDDSIRRIEGSNILI